MPPGQEILPKPSLLEKSASLLGFDFLTRVLSETAQSEPGRELGRTLLPYPSLEEALERLRETKEMVAVLGGEGIEGGETRSRSPEPPFPLERFQNIGTLADLASKGKILEGGEILPFLPLLRNADRVHRFFQGEGANWEALKRFGDLCRPIESLRRKIEESVDENGEIKPTATPELQEAHDRARGLYNRITNNLREMIRDQNFEDVLQDDYYTERENRFVLPVKAEQKNRVEGIVHDISASGQTYFIEPQPLIDLNNRLKTANLEVEMEIRRILRDISRDIADHHGELHDILSGLTALDLIWAKAALARRIGGVHPDTGNDVPLNLLQAGNPQLLLTPGQETVRNDIRLDPGKRVLVISGPNAGGKTVTLKTIGLMGLMVRAGLFIPASAGSSIPFFPEIYADIGDDQSIEESLSTFSSHLLTVNSVLRQAAPGSLVLLDELMISTDPHEGSALAIAILERFLEMGVLSVTTTHYPELKTFAQTHPGFENASVEYDARNMIPTYKLCFDLPGNSSAFQMAKRLGLDEAILSVARSRMVHGNERLATALQELEQKKSEVEEQKKSLLLSRVNLDRLSGEVEDRVRKLEEERTVFETERKQKLKRLVSEVRARFGELILQAETARTVKERGRFKKESEKLIRDLNVDEVPRETKPREQLQPGDPVFVKGLNIRGTLLEPPEKGKTARIQSEQMTVSANWENVIGVDPPTARPKGTPPPPKTKKPKPKEDSGECDLRGLFPEEALEKTIRFLDGAVRQNRSRVRIIHGHGKGVLRKVVREYLDGSPYADSYQAGEPREGGDGVTVVRLSEEGKK
jgi:DNA mismatch repair protein MutS2